MSATNPHDEYEALLYATERLLRRFPDVAEEAILQLIAGEVATFDHAKFRDYVPVLVEGRVRRQLQRTARGTAADTLLAS
ncbi:hypothetical protein J2X85_000019 [Microbacterium trichothecenolyticum]|uniref:three-helix bundle dimerization domain-containing protein n=1 Tax=Microbacterium trichothecenolyticum TaxID=69370 RepID=UPI00285BCB4C|nr:hypothetical protein [Microbacterium trichothecenolyticum]MDR7182996.1 hypothetical protein [Microbacterium trichothecenolyticum]